MSWPPEDPDMWAVENRFKGPLNMEEPDIRRDFSLSFNDDFSLNVKPHLKNGELKALACTNNGGEVLGWRIKNR